MLTAGTVVADWDAVAPQAVYHPIPRVFPWALGEEPRVPVRDGEEATNNLPPEVEEMIMGVDTALLPEEEQQLRELVWRYRDIFAVVRAGHGPLPSRMWRTWQGVCCGFTPLVYS